MFNKQLRQNIEALDAQIGELSKELEGIGKDTKYEVTIRKLKDLTELRGNLTKGKEDKVLSDAVVELDKQIEELAKIIATVQIDEEYEAKVRKLEDLTKVRSQLSEVRSKESNAAAVISGVVGISSVIMVLKHEKTDIITSKAFSIATKLFRGV